ILKQLAEERSKKINENCQNKAWPSLQGSWNNLSHLPLTCGLVEPEEKNAPVRTSEEKHLDCSSCKPESIIAYLDQALDYFKDRYGIPGFMELRSFMHSLEKTSAE